jgi:hypothetical protein
VIAQTWPTRRSGSTTASASAGCRSCGSPSPARPRARRPRLRPPTPYPRSRRRRRTSPSLISRSSESVAGRRQLLGLQVDGGLAGWALTSGGAHRRTDGTSGLHWIAESTTNVGDSSVPLHASQLAGNRWLNFNSTVVLDDTGPEFLCAGLYLSLF